MLRECAKETTAACCLISVLSFFTSLFILYIFVRVSFCVCVFVDKIVVGLISFFVCSVKRMS